MSSQEKNLALAPPFYPSSVADKSVRQRPRVAQKNGEQYLGAIPWPGIVAEEPPSLSAAKSSDSVSAQTLKYIPANRTYEQTWTDSHTDPYGLRGKVTASCKQIGTTSSHSRSTRPSRSTLQNSHPAQPRHSASFLTQPPKLPPLLRDPGEQCDEGADGWRENPFPLPLVANLPGTGARRMPLHFEQRRNIRQEESESCNDGQKSQSQNRCFEPSPPPDDHNVKLDGGGDSCAAEAPLVSLPLDRASFAHCHTLLAPRQPSILTLEARQHPRCQHSTKEGKDGGGSGSSIPAPARYSGKRRGSGEHGIHGCGEESLWRQSSGQVRRVKSGNCTDESYAIGTEIEYASVQKEDPQRSIKGARNHSKQRLSSHSPAFYPFASRHHPPHNYYHQHHHQQHAPTSASLASSTPQYCTSCPSPTTPTTTPPLIRRCMSLRRRQSRSRGIDRRPTDQQEADAWREVREIQTRHQDGHRRETCNEACCHQARVLLHQDDWRYSRISYKMSAEDIAAPGQDSRCLPHPRDALKNDQECPMHNTSFQHPVISRSLRQRSDIVSYSSPLPDPRNAFPTPLKQKRRRSTSIGEDMGPRKRPKPAQSSARKRSIRVAMACENCRAQKRKCDGNQPCSLCQKRNHHCTYQVTSAKPLVKTPEVIPSATKMAVLHGDVDAAAVKQHMPLTPSDTHLPSSSSAITTVTSLENPARERSSEKNDIVPAEEDLMYATSYESNSTGFALDDEDVVSEQRYGAAQGQYTQVYREVQRRSVSILSQDSQDRSTRAASATLLLPQLESAVQSSPVMSSPQQDFSLMRRLSLGARNGRRLSVISAGSYQVYTGARVGVMSGFHSNAIGLYTAPASLPFPSLRDASTGERTMRPSTTFVQSPMPVARSLPATLPSSPLPNYSSPPSLHRLASIDVNATPRLIRAPDRHYWLGTRRNSNWIAAATPEELGRSGTSGTAALQ